MASGPKLAHSERVEPWFFRANMKVDTNEAFFSIKLLVVYGVSSICGTLLCESMLKIGLYVAMPLLRGKNRCNMISVLGKNVSTMAKTWPYVEKTESKTRPLA